MNGQFPVAQADKASVKKDDEAWRRSRLLIKAVILHIFIIQPMSVPTKFYTCLFRMKPNTSGILRGENWWGLCGLGRFEKI